MPAAAPEDASEVETDFRWERPLPKPLCYFVSGVSLMLR